ncbi:MAG: McrB family protein [Marinifilaceae bacterium]
METLYLNGHRIYKLSMGIFLKNTSFRNNDLPGKFEKLSWGVMHKDTANSQGYNFQHKLKIGDYVYITYGRDKLSGLYRITSESKVVNEKLEKLIGDEGFIYRKLEKIKDPIVDHTRELVEDKRGWLPSGYSTFFEVQDLEEANRIFFYPYYGIEVQNSNNVEKDSSVTKNQSQNPLNQILYGPPGTGKTFNTINKAIEIINPGFDLNQEREIVKEEFDCLMNEGQVVFTTFHQSMTYEDFVEGIKPQEPKEDGQPISYAVEDGIFKRLSKKANPTTGNYEQTIEAFKKEISEVDGKSPIAIEGKGTHFDVTYRGTSVFYVQPHASTKENPWYPVNISNISKAFETGDYNGVYNPTYVREIISFLENHRGLKRGQGEEKKLKPYVLIIDEINRGNVSQIFGELITLIEEDKRLGKKEALEVALPYSKEKFGVPSNLYIIGTMNTADRSVEALDTALRRRFCFVEMPPIPELIKTVGKSKENKGLVDGFDLVRIMETVNKRIEKLLDKDHLIGHSYFLNVASLEDLKKAFWNNIIPLLQEYFYGDYGKIGLVLGRGFFKNEGQSQNDDENIFADFNGYDASLLMEKPVYKLCNLSEISDLDFSNDIRILLGMSVEGSVESKLVEGVEAN